MNNTWKTTAALGAIIALTACNTSGSTRYASVGTQPQAVSPKPKPVGASEEVNNNPDTDMAGPAGPAGPAGAPGPVGPVGPAGPQGVAGEDGGQFALGQTGMIATGGLVGSEGLAGTGLFANLGDPSTSIPGISDASAGIGTVVASLGGGLDDVVSQIDQTGQLTTLTSPVTETVSNVGTALTSFGTDGAPLVDGVTSSVSPLLTASIGGGDALGDSSGTSALGVSVLSAGQTSGSVGEVGVASNGSLLNVDLATSSDTGLSLGGLANVDLGPVTAGLNDLDGASDLSGTLDETLTDTVGDVLSGDLADSSPASTPVVSTVTGLLGGLGLN